MMCACVVKCQTHSGSADTDVQKALGAVGGLKNYLITRMIWHGGPGSSVGIATDYGLDGPGIELAASVV
jgi:hypothetical protein